jgi:hypothetical protein
MVKDVQRHLSRQELKYPGARRHEHKPTARRFTARPLSSAWLETQLPAYREGLAAPFAAWCQRE